MSSSSLCRHCINICTHSDSILPHYCLPYVIFSYLQFRLWTERKFSFASVLGNEQVYKVERVPKLLEVREVMMRTIVLTLESGLEIRLGEETRVQTHQEKHSSKNTHTKPFKNSEHCS